MKLALTLLAAAIGLTLIGSAHAVHLDRGGRGQVLIYPYYTVQNGQQTLLSVTNTSSSAQAVKVRFHEGYNNREVLDFNLWLPAYDVWTATVFALADAGLPGEGAAIMTSDRSCTTPQFSTSGLTLNGNAYMPFVNYDYSATNVDGGPTSHSRTREGYMEIIAMTDVGAPLLAAITHNTTSGIPANCMAVQPNSIMGTPAVSTRPSGGLMGAASIINVSQGTLLATRAEALAGFTNVSLFTGTDYVYPNLEWVNDVFSGGAATAHLFDDQGRAQHLSYGGPGITTSRPIDAVSALLMADQVYNEYVISPTLNAGSDWVLTFPTKQFYVDPLFAGSTTVARPPFEAIFTAGRSTIQFGHAAYDRKTKRTEIAFGGTPPPSELSMMHYATNTLPFLNRGGGPAVTQSAVLGSRLLGTFGGYSPVTNPFPFDAGWAALNLEGYSAHALPASNEGKVLRGLPVIGFWATNLVNNNVSNGVLSNYATAVRHATSVTCKNGSGSTATPCE